VSEHGAVAVSHERPPERIAFAQHFDFPPGKLAQFLASQLCMPHDAAQHVVFNAPPWLLPSGQVPAGRLKKPSVTKCIAGLVLLSLHL
jgi:hypothetical protein